MKKILLMSLSMFLMAGCSSQPSRSDVATIIENTGVLITSKPVNAEIEIGRTKRCGGDANAAMYALMRERGWADVNPSGSIELTSKGKVLFQKLGANPHQGGVGGCNYEFYLVPMGKKKRVEVTGLAQLSNSAMLAKYSVVVELNEFGKDMTVGSDFCNKYMTTGNSGTCPDVESPMMFAVPGQEGFATTGEYEAHLVKFDDGWKVE